MTFSTAGRRWASGALAAVGALLVLFGLAALLVVFLAVPNMLEDGIKKSKLLLPETDTLEKWVNPPYVSSINVFLFDVLNPDGIAIKGDKPVLKQRGPYAFRVKQEKRDVAFSPDKNSVAYRPFMWYYFDQENSCDKCSGDDLITIPNAFFLTVYSQMRHLKLDEKQMATFSFVLGLFGEKLFVRKKVMEILFTGYKDPILDVLNSPLIKPFVQQLDVPERVALFYKRNGTGNDVFNVSTGQADVNAVGKVNSFNGVTVLPKDWWSTEQARMINGSDGSLYKPFLDNADAPYVFVSDLCRSVRLGYMSASSSVDGRLPALRFTVPPAALDTGRPENAGFCPPGTNYTEYYPGHTKSCLPPGLLDVRNCQPGKPPIVVSLPHFLNCPDYVQKSVQGLDPSPQIHSTHIDLEPRTGVGLLFNQKLQLNIRVDQDKHFFMLQKLHPVIIPIAWLNVSATIDAGTLGTIESQLALPDQLESAGRPTGFASLFIGLFLAAAGFLALCIIAKQNRDASVAPEPSPTSAATVETSPVGVANPAMRHDDDGAGRLRGDTDASTTSSDAALFRR